MLMSALGRKQTVARAGRRPLQLEFLSSYVVIGGVTYEHISLMHSEGLADYSSAKPSNLHLRPCSGALQGVHYSGGDLLSIRQLPLGNSTSGEALPNQFGLTRRSHGAVARKCREQTLVA